jgi:hypothetical protein
VPDGSIDRLATSRKEEDNAFPEMEEATGGRPGMERGVVLAPLEDSMG